MRQRGKDMGSEFVGKGVNIVLGPAMNMGRVAQGVTIQAGIYTECADSYFINSRQELGKLRG